MSHSTKSSRPPESTTAESALLSGPLAWITGWVIWLRVPVVVLAVAVTVFSISLAVDRLGFRASRLDLLNPESDYNKLWIEYIQAFGDADDVVVVVEGDSRRQVVPVLDEISQTLLEQDHLFRAVLHKVDLSPIREKGLHYLPEAELAGIDGFLRQVEPITGGEWNRLSVGNMVRELSGRLTYGSRLPADAREQTIAELDRTAEGLLAAFDPATPHRSLWPDMPEELAALDETGPEYFLTNEGRLGIVLLRLAEIDGERFAQGTDAIDGLRDLIDRASARHPETTIGLTGLPVMENDEMRSSQSAMLAASILSLLGVACLFVAGFGGMRHPLITVGVLLLAIAWSFGYITLAVGHLNILSIAFGVILIGLGIDFGIHYVARYLQLRERTDSPEEALVATAGSVGPGIVTGAVTTSIAFFMAGLTEFTGIAELGIIAGGGILLCCAAALLVLPAVIYMADAGRIGETLPVPLDIHGWLRPIFARPMILLILTTLGTIGLASGMSRLRYDHNLLNLQQAGLQSVELERKLLEESDQSVWFALSIANDREQLLARKERFLQLPSVARVSEIASLFPADNGTKGPMIERIHGRLASLPEHASRIAVTPPIELAEVLRGAQAVLASRPETVHIARRFEQVGEVLRRASPEEYAARVSEYQNRVAGELLARLGMLRAMSNPQPPRLTDLPEGLVRRFVGSEGQFLLQIYAKGDIWDMEAMREFVGDVRGVDPRVTGNPLQTYEASVQMKRSYEQAAWYALAAILIVLYADFRSFRLTLLALVPLGLGMLQLFGLLGLLNIPLNPANMIVLPLILGIGIDDGVHVVHDFQRQRGPYRMSASTASAVVITSLTTMIGFGSMMIASHRGLQSLGRVLTIGVTCCLITSLLMLPALLTWMTRHRREV